MTGNKRKRPVNSDLSENGTPAEFKKVMVTKNLLLSLNKWIYLPFAGTFTNLQKFSLQQA